MTPHHDRVLAVLLVHGLEADRRADTGEQSGGDPVTDLTARVIRIQARLDAVRSPRQAGGRVSDGRASVDTSADAEVWLMAVYDAALVELCAAVGIIHGLLDDGVCPEYERMRVELELLCSVLPLG